LLNYFIQLMPKLHFFLISLIILYTFTSKKLHLLFYTMTGQCILKYLDFIKCTEGRQAKSEDRNDK
jgi:hypothetical protein